MCLIGFWLGGVRRSDIKMICVWKRWIVCFKIWWFFMIKHGIIHPLLVTRVRRMSPRAQTPPSTTSKHQQAQQGSLTNTQTTPLPLHNKRLTLNEHMHSPREAPPPPSPCTWEQNLHMAIPVHHKPMPLPHQTQTWHPYYHHCYIFQVNHTLNHPKPKPIIH